MDTIQIATITAEGDIVELARQQREDAELEPIIVSLENGKEEGNFALVDNVPVSLWQQGWESLTTMCAEGGQGEVAEGNAQWYLGWSILT